MDFIAAAQGDDVADDHFGAGVVAHLFFIDDAGGIGGEVEVEG